MCEHSHQVPAQMQNKCFLSVHCLADWKSNCSSWLQTWILHRISNVEEILRRAGSRCISLWSRQFPEDLNVNRDPGWENGKATRKQPSLLERINIFDIDYCRETIRPSLCSLPETLRSIFCKHLFCNHRNCLEQRRTSPTVTAGPLARGKYKR